SGSGKSTLLGLICGTLTPQKGDIYVLGKNITVLTSSQRDRVRADHFGIIFQMFNLLPYLSILDNVLLPLNFSKLRKTAAIKQSGNIVTEADRLLTALGVDATKFGQQKTSDLSVGQQQRVAAARAFIGYPEIIVADEPTSSLDEGHQAKFMQLLFEETERTGATLIMVSHDRRLAKRFDRVVELSDLCRSETELVQS
ncbi:MAG: ATP-binding cassette domain-containing protein, partial [Hyphomicrobiales bacterium]|nr:ATP-binding cassette domain-containing protein [Hyphomicrobiales bacterium]